MVPSIPLSSKSHPANPKHTGPLQSFRGYGSGLTVQQATEAIRAMPNLLSMHYEDSRKPSMLYFYQELGVPPLLCREAEVELSRYLTGTDSSDACAFAYLRTLGASWDQCRILLDAFPVLTACDTNPGWELACEGPVRKELNEDLMLYLRKRLQVGAGEVYHMMKVGAKNV